MSSRERLLRDLARSKEFRAAFVKSHTKRLLPLQLHELMEQRGYTQTKLAELSGLSQGTISRAIDPEYGNLTVNTCVSLAAGFDVAFVGAFIPYSRFLKWLDEEGDLVELPAFDEEFDEHGELQARTAARVARNDNLLVFIQRLNDAPQPAQQSGQMAFAFPNPPAKVIELFTAPFHLELPDPHAEEGADSEWHKVARGVAGATNG